MSKEIIDLLEQAYQDRHPPPNFRDKVQERVLKVSVFRALVLLYVDGLAVVFLSFSKGNRDLSHGSTSEMSDC